MVIEAYRAVSYLCVCSKNAIAGLMSYRMSSSLHVIRGLVWVAVVLFIGGPHHDAAPGHVGHLESWTRNGGQNMGSKKRRPWGYPQ